MRAQRKFASVGRTVAEPESAGLWGLAWNRLRRNRRAMIGLYLLVLLGTTSVLAPVLAPYDRDATAVGQKEQPPSASHWLGTDALGRDVLTRLLYGGQISLTVGVVAVSIYLTIGVVLGALAGYYGGLVDGFMMRLTDIVMAFPFLPLALTVAVMLGPSIYNTMLILGLLGWTSICRLVRGEFLSLRTRDFVQAARASGASDLHIILRHMLPNAIAPILVAATLGVAGAILSEAALSFLGMGVRQPLPSWGNMLSDAQSYRTLLKLPWLWVPPGLMIFIAVLSINLLGDGLRDALDPRLKE